MPTQNGQPYSFTIGKPERIEDRAPEALQLKKRMEELNEIHRQHRAGGKEGILQKRRPLKAILDGEHPLILPLTFRDVADMVESTEPIQEALLELPAVIVEAEQSSSNRAWFTLFVIVEEHAIDTVKDALQNLQP